MKYALILITLLFALGCSKSTSEHDSGGTEHQEHQDHTAHDSSTADKKPKSPAQMAMANVGNSHVHIEYNAPSKRGRVIFGGLVAYDEVWVTGAHSATTINFSEADPECDLNYVPNKAVKKEVSVALSNTFGFGGHNASLLFKKADGAA